VFAAEYAQGCSRLSERKPAKRSMKTALAMAHQALQGKSAEFEALRPLTRVDYDKVLAIVERELGASRSNSSPARW
jgi:hypothetical protein